MRKMIIFCVFIVLIFNTLFAVQNCLDFNFDNVHVDHDTSLNMGTGGITVEAWIKTSINVPENYWPVIVGKEMWGPRQGFNLFIAHHTNKVAFEIWHNGTWYGIWGQVVNDGKWHHVVGKRNGDYISSYKDGVRSTWHRPGASGNVNNDYQLVIGHGSWGTGGYFEGMIDEVRVWNCVLSDEEIHDMMFRELDGTETNLQAYYQFNETSGTIAPDLTANSNDGTLAGDPSWTASYAPLASELLDSLSNIRGVWNAKTSHTSSIMTISDADISGNNRIIFGHNSDTLAFNSTNVPGNVINRLSRLWRIEKYGNLIGDISFDCTGIVSDETYVLLVDDDGDFSNAEIYEGVVDSLDFFVHDHTFLHSYYYTLGISLPSPENVIIHTQNDSVHISWDGVAEANSYSIYSSTNPHEQPQNWTLEETGIADTTWTEAAIGEKKFYFVKASN